MLKRCEMKVLWIAALLLAPMPAAFAEDLRLVMPFSPGERLDPAFEYAGWYMRQAGVYETLFSYDTEMNLVPELAEGYELASETEWIVHLREGVVFHDGTPLNADAVIYSIDRVKNDPENRWYDQYSFVDSVSVIDDYTIKIVTKVPYAPTLSTLADIRFACIVSTRRRRSGRRACGHGSLQVRKLREGMENIREIIRRRGGGDEAFWTGLTSYPSGL